MFAELRCPYQVDVYDESDFEKDPALLDLDPITVAGALRTDELLSATSLPCAAWAREILEGDVGFSRIGEQTRIPYVSSRWKKHMESLEAATILRCEGELNHKKHYPFICGYFGIAKDENWARSILNGKALSRLCRRPPNVNLLDIRDLLRLVAHIKIPVSFYQFDMRHWFHQCRLKKGGRLESLFTLLFHGKVYRWTCLPMGFSFSPFVCQVLIWALLLFTESCEAPLWFTEDTLGVLPPKFVRLRNPRTGDECGFITVLYDNVGIFCTEPNLLDNLIARIRRNITRFGAVVKPGSEKLFHPKQMNVQALRYNCPVHLGVQFGFRREFGLYHAQWRVSPAKIDEWKQTPFPSGLSTPRRIARIAGRVMWHASLQLKPLYKVKAAITAIIEAAEFVGGVMKRWDEPFQCNATTSMGLEELWNTVLDNNWTGYKLRTCTNKLYLFTDACEKGWGFVLADEQGSVLTQRSRPFKSAAKTWHIYIKEVAAAIWAVRAVAGLIPKDTRLILCVDNTAAQFSLRRGYTSNAIAQSLIEKMYNGLTFDVQLERVHTKKNPADELSRRKHLQPEKVAAAVATIHVGVETMEPPPEKNDMGLRHNIDDVLEDDEDARRLRQFVEVLCVDPASE